MLRDLDPTAFVPVTDAARARSFYVDLLGLELVEESPFAVVVRAGRTTVRLTPVDGHAPGGFTVLGWEVPDAVGAGDALTAAGVTMLRFDGMDQDERGVWDSPSGARMAWFADPDGNTLSVTQL